MTFHAIGLPSGAVRAGPKRVGPGANGTSAQGTGLALSSDGNTGFGWSPMDYGYVCAAWVFTRTGGIWSQQGEKLRSVGAYNSRITQALNDGRTFSVRVGLKKTPRG